MVLDLTERREKTITVKVITKRAIYAHRIRLDHSGNILVYPKKYLKINKKAIKPINVKTLVNHTK